MKLIFEYNKERDIWCLLNKGKSSNNNPNPTKVYELLITKYGENQTEETVSNFIDEYLLGHNVNIKTYIEKYLTEWLQIANEYYKRAEAIFGVTLPQDITAYLTVNNRNPYSIENNFLYVTVPRETVRKNIMHELWHFYTWYRFGVTEEEKLGKEKYNTIKEALTVLLNVECADLMPYGLTDEGYPQHQILRKKI